MLGNVANLGAALPSGSVGQSFGLEILLTAALTFVIISVATDTRRIGETATIAVGATVGLDALYRIVQQCQIRAGTLSFQQYLAS